MNNSKNKKLFAGPFVGEFGWELFCWQGYIRYLAENKFDHTTVCCLAGHSALYEDFADEIIEYDLPNHNPNCQYHKGNLPNLPKPDSTFDLYVSPNTEKAPSYNSANGFFDNRYPQIFQKYKADKPSNTFDVLINARSRTQSAHVSTGERNLSIEKWNEVVQFLKDRNFSVASIGTERASYHIDGTTDLRGISLRSLIGYMCHSKSILGPSSGPLHLQALCGKPIIVWSGDIFNKYRYEKSWNPFGVPVKYLNGWSNVKLDDIKKAINDI